jgi:hypothetical protein
MLEGDSFSRGIALFLLTGSSLKSESEKKEAGAFLLF